MKKLWDFFDKTVNQKTESHAVVTNPEIKVYIWEKSIDNGTADIGHAGISVDGNYYSLWPTSGFFPPLGPFKLLPLPAVFSSSLVSDELMQDKPKTDMNDMKDMNHIPIRRRADRVFLVDSSIDSRAVVAKIAQYQQMLIDHQLGYQFFDNYHLLSHIVCSENFREIRTDPFSGALMKESYDRFPPPSHRNIPEGLNCTGFVISILNEGLANHAKLSTNRFFPWRRSPDRLAVDLSENNFFHEIENHQDLISSAKHH